MSTLNNLHALSLSVVRLGRGLIAHNARGKQPTAPLHVYEFEACPFCRKLREVLSELDLDYVCHPCGRGSSKRAFVQDKGGKQQFPYLIDDNTGFAGYESEALITYLYETYGAGRSALGKALSPLNTAGAALASGMRHRGRQVRAGSNSRSQPEKLLELWNFEASPYCRKVRETLCELDLDYVVHNVAKRGRKRPQLVALGGKMRVPYLVDANTGTAMYESDDIVAYLERTY